MSINNCCCGDETVPPQGITAQQACSNSETIMSQTGLITDMGCGIKPVIGEILGLQQQSRGWAAENGPIQKINFGSKGNFVFGYALSHNVSQTSTIEDNPNGEIFEATPTLLKISPQDGTQACYWIWWTKNRCLELDIKFPITNFSGCIQQSDNAYWKGVNHDYHCSAFPIPEGGQIQHNGDSCWNSNLIAPFYTSNLYLNGNVSYNLTLTQAVDHNYGMFAGMGDMDTWGQCVGFDRGGVAGVGCAPRASNNLGGNQVGNYCREGQLEGIYITTYVHKYNDHNVKYPTSTVAERYAALPFGTASTYQSGSSADKENQPRNCLWNDQSVPPDMRKDFNGNIVHKNCTIGGTEITANGLSPYQRRVAEERSPDIWEIHEFNDSYPVKIKYMAFNENVPAKIKVWGKNSDDISTTIANQELVESMYTDISAGGDNLAAVRQNKMSGVFGVHPILTYPFGGAVGEKTLETERIIYPQESRVVVTSDISDNIKEQLNDLAGMETVWRPWKSPKPEEIIGKSIRARKNYIKRVATGFNHTICTRENGTAEVSLYYPELTEDRMYYGKSVPSVFQWVPSISTDWGQIDVPFSPGSNKYKYDWIDHEGCTLCNGPLFETVDHTVVQEDIQNNESGDPCLDCDARNDLNPDETTWVESICVGDTIKKPIGSCRFGGWDPKEINLNCRRKNCFSPSQMPNMMTMTPWFSTVVGQMVHLGILMDALEMPGLQCKGPCWPGIVPGMRYGKLTCQGGNESTAAPATNCSAKFCQAEFPPLNCSTVKMGNTPWYICGTGGFNDTYHEYTDYAAWTCGNYIINYDENYCEGIQVWDEISAGGYHNIAINKYSTFNPISNGVTLATCHTDGGYAIGDAYNKDTGSNKTNVVAWGAGDPSFIQSDFCNTDEWPHFGQGSVPPDLGYCKRVSGGGYHSLVIKNDNKLKSWGAGPSGCPTCTVNDIHNVHFGQSIIPLELENKQFKEISAGQYHSCAIETDGTVHCWGAGITTQVNGGTCGVNWGQSVPGTTLGPCLKISCGGFHTCAIKENGTVKCWGKNTMNQCEIDFPYSSCVQISCGLNFSAGRFIIDAYDSHSYYNSQNFEVSPVFYDLPSGQSALWPVSLFRYFFAFASMEFTYGRGVTPARKGICDVNWSKSLPKAIHQRSDAVHVFSFEKMHGDDDNDINEPMTETGNEYQPQTFSIQSLQTSTANPQLVNFAGTETICPEWRRACQDMDKRLRTPYWSDRMSCKDWRGEVYNDLRTVLGSFNAVDWSQLLEVVDKYTSPSVIKPLGAYRIRGDIFDIRDARNDMLNLEKRPPALAKMAANTRMGTPDAYRDDTDGGKYTLQVNKDIYSLTVPDNVELTKDQQDAFNRLTLSVYFRPKPIGWDNSGMDWIFAGDWPSSSLAGGRSWRYGWLNTARNKTFPLSFNDIWSSTVTTGIGTNNLFAINDIRPQSQGQPWWDTLNKGSNVGTAQGGIVLQAACDIIGPQVAYTSNAHIYTARHILGIQTSGGGVGQKHQGYWIPKSSPATAYSCSLIKMS